MATPGFDPVRLHLRALVFIEQGQRRSAESALLELHSVAPTYLPGLLERALLHVRYGEAAKAGELMRDIFKRTETLPPDMMLAGPEELPVSYYRACAQAFLDSNKKVPNER
jgi:hypothetical protein